MAEKKQNQNAASYLQMPLPEGKNKGARKKVNLTMPLPEGKNRLVQKAASLKVPLPEGKNRLVQKAVSLKVPLPEGKNRLAQKAASLKVPLPEGKNKAVRKEVNLQTPLPDGATEKTSVRVNWSGLNKRHETDTGELSVEKNVSTLAAPYLTPSEARKAEFSDISIDSPIGMWGFDDFLLVICKINDSVGAIKIYSEMGFETAAFNTLETKVEEETDEGDTVTTTFKDKYADDFETKRSVVAFNVYEGGAIDGKYVKKLLIFPDKVSMNFEGDMESAIIPDNIMPDIKYATVHLSRVYGAAARAYKKDEDEMPKEADRLVVSGFNDYTNWNVDTDDDFSEAHAWVSAAQSNVKATGEFTGITTYLNSVVAFKNDYMHEITGRSNPFKINDVFGEGAISNESIVDVDGALFFVSKDGVKVYTGGNPRIMSYKLNIERFLSAVGGCDGRGRYYLYCEDEEGTPHLFVYDTSVMEWAEEEIDKNLSVISFAKNENGFYALVYDGDADEGQILRLDTGDYSNQIWSAETDITLGRTVDIKHIAKIQLLADIEDGSSLKVSVVYDEGSPYEREETVFEKLESTKTRCAIRVVPRMTAHWGAKLKIEGKGYVCVYQAEITLRGGGELFTTLRDKRDTE